ncbi:hypothetical protein QQP08_022608 [Theobroma cacao]|uniref:Uncharacterized protein n=1 Tax=Theobroma cacao TaxID=3641 RepID=A0A061FFY1_THECC|nr:Uncharacterized protein TCM_034774 [Theobroma cacao]WRX30121.1 hypothetical protein QQP08_022608 [Theobroma cacao]
MAKNSSTSYSSMKRHLFVLGLLALLVSTEFTAVDGRALRSKTNNVVVAGCEEQGGADEQVAVSTFAVSANNSSSRPSVRSLASRLASGPSKRGPGH